MITNKLKTLALLGAIALGTILAPQSAKAQDTVNATITQDGAITTVDVADMGFGTWFLAVVGGDVFTLTMNSSTGVVTAAGNVGSFATELTAGTGEGQVTAELPLGADGIIIQMTPSAITDFTDPGLTLSSLTYSTATQGVDDPLTPLVAAPVTCVTGGTPEPITFGGVIDVSATPADGLDTASFTVTFAY